MVSKDNIEYIGSSEELDDMNGKPIYITDLIEAETLQKIQDAFAKMSQMAAITSDENGVAVTKPSNFSEFCNEFCRKSPIGKARCENCDKMGAVMALEEKKPISYFCHANLVDFAAPIMLGSRMIGSFVGGQVLSEEPDYERMRQIAKEIEVDEDEFVRAAKKTHIVKKDAIDRATAFIYEYAGILSDMAYKAYRSRRLSEEAMHLATQKSDFLANMSHEIRTPMNAILGMTEMALRENMTPEAKEYLHQINSSGKNLLVIINDILDFSKIESGKMDIIEVSYEPMSLIIDIASIINSRIGTKDIEFTMDIPCNMPRRLMGDSVRIQQIFINLLNNAVKFTNSGEVHLRLDFIPIDDKTVTLKAAVSDTGIGIRKKDLDKLFQSFQQVDSKRNRNIEGTGLGLAISQQLLKLMNGKISVQSVYEKGSTFSFELPQKLVSAEPFAEPPEGSPKVCILVRNEYLKKQIVRDLIVVNADITDVSDSGSFEHFTSGFFIVGREAFVSTVEDFAAAHPEVRFIIIDKYNAVNNTKLPNVRTVRKPVFSFELYAAMDLMPEFTRGESYDNGEDFAFVAPDAHILIVDDNSVNLTVASGLLEPLGMKIDLAGNAEQAIEKLSNFMYDIIFMDHMMPEVDGIDVTHIIRRMMPRYDNVPIIALTANAVGSAREMFLAEGMNDFVAKPIEMKEIVSKIRKWLPEGKIIPVENSGEDSAANDIPQIEGLNVEAAMSLLGSRNLFLSVLKEYYSSIEKRAESIANNWKTGNIRNYTVEVHSVKSTSKQIGAENVSALAARLERAGNENDIDFINSNTEDLLKEFLAYKEILAPYFPDVGLPGTKKQASDDETEAMLVEMLDAIDDMDILLIDEVIEKLSEYDFGEPQNGYLEKLSAAAEAYDTDLCSQITNDWFNSIKK